MDDLGDTSIILETFLSLAFRNIGKCCYRLVSLDPNFECVRSPDFINNALPLNPESFKFNRSIDPYPKIFLISALMSTFASESSMKSSISLSYSESLSSLRL